MRGHGGHGPGGRGRGAESAPPIDRTEVAGWFAGRLPDDRFTGPVDLTIERDEITVVGTLPEPTAEEGDRAAAWAGRINRFCEASGGQRMAVAVAAHARYARALA